MAFIVPTGDISGKKVLRSLKRPFVTTEIDSSVPVDPSHTH